MRRRRVRDQLGRPVPLRRLALLAERLDISSCVRRQQALAAVLAYDHVLLIPVLAVTMVLCRLRERTRRRRRVLIQARQLLLVEILRASKHRSVVAQVVVHIQKLGATRSCLALVAIAATRVRASLLRKLRALLSQILIHLRAPARTNAPHKLLVIRSGADLASIW